jgi:GR25 family glycosyltransferase involved in LPS biosynthesis
MSSARLAPAYRGVYINLDGSHDRNRSIEDQLARYAIADRYTRLAAIDGLALPKRPSGLAPGEVGCFASHHQAVRSGLGQSRHWHVIEDDVLLCARTSAVLDVLAPSALEEFDILFTDLMIPLQVEPIRQFKALYDRLVSGHGPVNDPSFGGFSIVDLKGLWFAGASSYLVGQRALSKLHGLLTVEWDLGPRMPVDLLLAAATYEGRIRAGCVFPFVTSIKLEHTLDTTMPDRHADNRSVLVTNIVRQSFYVDCDWQRCSALLDQICQGLMPGQQETLISQALCYKLFGDFHSF